MDERHDEPGGAPIPSEPTPQAAPAPEPAPAPAPAPAPTPAAQPAPRVRVRTGRVGAGAGGADVRVGRVGGGGGGRTALSGCLALVVLSMVAMGVLFMLFLFAVASAGGPGGPAIGSQGQLPPGAATLRERYRSGHGNDRIALIGISGVIMGSDGSGGAVIPGAGDLVTRVRLQLARAAVDDSVKAIVLDIDSPGGGVTASDLIWRLIEEFKTTTKKPVVAAMGSVAASGGYYVAVPADHIVAQETTITGSIGVIMSPLVPLNFGKWLEERNIEHVAITSGPNKNMLDPFMPMDGEVGQEHRKILQGMVDDMYGRFVEVIVLGRKDQGLDEPTVRRIGDGRIYSAKQALENKMIDEIGYLDDAIAKAEELAKIPNATAFRYIREPTLADLFGIQMGIGQPQQSRAAIRVEVDPQALLEASTPRMWYLWAPGMSGGR